MRPRTDTQRHRHTDARDRNTVLVVYDSREMQLVDMALTVASSLTRVNFVAVHTPAVCV